MKYIIVSLLLLACVLTLNSCKNEISGCTNSAATNFNAKATEDDGTCTYRPFQGPLNPGFEENDESWMQSGGNGTAMRRSGTGFMPTKGRWYM